MSARLHRLSNGVRVLCDPMPGLRTLAVSAVVRGGARWEDAARSGWSHLLEHMVFKGAGDMSSREIVERIEARGGNINAATGHERTSFQVRALEGGLELALQVASDLVFRPTMAADELAREKDVVAQEIAEAFDAPDDHVFELAQGAAFGDHPLGRPILGSVESTGAATAEAMQAWRAALYAPERIALSVAGAVDETELLALAERWFGQVAPGASTPEPEPAAFVGGAQTLARSIEQANVVFLLPGPGATHPDHPVLRLFAEILGGGMASRLFQEAREVRGLAYAVDAYAEGYEDVGALGVYAGCAPGKAAELAALTAEQICKLAEAPDAAELDRAKAQLKGSLFMSQESPLARAERAAFQTFLFGAPRPAEETAERLDAVTLADLRRVGEGLLAPRRSAAAILGPKSALKAARAFQASL